MKKALILGASGGIGGALCRALKAREWQVTGLSRTADALDLTDEQSVSCAASRLKDQRFEMIFNATGALVINGAEPEKSISAITAQAMADQFALNAIGPALALKYFSPLLAGRREGARAVFASLSARVGSIGDNRLGGWISYRAAKAAQNQILHTAAIEVARHHKGAIVVALHPGTVKTPLTAKYAGRHPTITRERATEALLSVLDGLSPADTGGFFDWLGKAVTW